MWGTSHGLDLTLGVDPKDLRDRSVSCRIVVRDFATGWASALNSGIYAPTSSLDGLRCVLAVSVVKDLSLLTADVSVAFMNAPVEAEACDLVLLPANMSINGCRVIAWLGKAMNGPGERHCCGFSNYSEWCAPWEVKTAEGEARYRRVLGQLAWAALSRADLCFSVSYLARFQSKPSGAAEACLRALLRWLLTRLHCVQTMPSPEGSPSVGLRSVVGFCDASWNVASMSGGVLMFQGCCIKVFSRKQECPALSSAEAALCAMTENSKELVSLGMLLESILDGIPLTILGTPQCTTGTYHLVLRNDATAAISISSMEGLLRRVRHIELRAKYIQMLVKKRRLLLEHIPGFQNPSDGLTKSIC